MPSSAIGAGAARYSRPLTLTRPAVGSSRPAIIRIVVDLPAPFGPRKPVTTPGGTTKSSPSTASVSPYRLLRFSTSIIACSLHRWRRSPRHATHARNHPPGPASAQRPQAEQATYAPRPIRPPPHGLSGPAPMMHVDGHPL